MGFVAFAAKADDNSELPAYLQPQKVAFGGSEDVETAKVLAEEAFLLKEHGQGTVAHVRDDKTNLTVYKAVGTGPYADKAKANVTDRQAKAAAVKAAKEALRLAESAASAPPPSTSSAGNE